MNDTQYSRTVRTQDQDHHPTDVVVESGGPWPIKGLFSRELGRSNTLSTSQSARSPGQIGHSIRNTIFSNGSSVGATWHAHLSNRFCGGAGATVFDYVSTSQAHQHYLQNAGEVVFAADLLAWRSGPLVTFGSIWAPDQVIAPGPARSDRDTEAHVPAAEFERATAATLQELSLLREEIKALASQLKAAISSLDAIADAHASEPVSSVRLASAFLTNGEAVESPFPFVTGHASSSENMNVFAQAGQAQPDDDDRNAVSSAKLAGLFLKRK